MERLERLIAELHDFTTAATVYSGRCDWEFSQRDVARCRVNLQDAMQTLEQVEAALLDETDEAEMEAGRGNASRV